MAVRVTPIDLARPLVPVTLGKRYASVWILVKFGPQPLGWIKCSRKTVGAVIPVELLAQLIAETLPLQIMDVARNRAFEVAPGNAAHHRPMISVVVCTREHPDVLQRQLASLGRL